ncbi:MAG: 23S rRNA (guanosine(2251)-2'-O)-methyltransferase RlmB [Proteobacteria bacterium]|nr:23S rRNA (guanosine(2251)-2'-O)-methyltransferase RlmB [Pseudomonadota bacterium]
MSHKKGPVSATRNFKRKPSELPEGVFLVEGIAAIREYAKFRPESILKIIIKDSRDKNLNALVGQLPIDKKLIEQSVSEAMGDSSNSFQSPVVAHVHHELIQLHDFEKCLDVQYEKKGLILALDHISDPRNLGAILRSAGFFGIKHVIVPERRQVLLTQSAVNTAQGGFAVCDLVVVVNLSRALERLKEFGFWVVSADMEGLSLDQFKEQQRFEKTVLVLGNEESGVSKNILDRSDLRLSISGVDSGLESLNVSVAAGILMNALKNAKSQIDLKS